MSKAKSEFDLEKLLPIEQLSLLLKQSYPAFVATIAVMLFIIYKVHNTIDTFWLTTWVSVVVVINIFAYMDLSCTASNYHHSKY